MNKARKRKRMTEDVAGSAGFTLIELLVVIAIIGLLSSTVLASLNSARSQARDARRISDIEQIQLALELYYDTNGNYPISGNCEANDPNGGWCNSVQSMQNGYWIRNGNDNLSAFLPSAVTDPQQGDDSVWVPLHGGTYFYYSYNYGGSGQWYMLVFGLENEHSIEQNDGVTACDGTRFHYGNDSSENNNVVTVGNRAC